MKRANKWLRKHKIWGSLITLLVIYALIAIPIGITDAIHQNDEKKKQEAAFAAEQARLAADPVTIPNIYNALNKSRSASGASALSSLPNLTTAAQQFCNDMVANKYFDYKNPLTGKDANGSIKDNIGNLYFKNYVASIFKASPGSQTAADAVNAAVAAQSTNISNPMYNSVGWATCQSPTALGQTYVVGMFADKEDKPVTPVNNYYSTPRYTPIYPPPLYTPSVHCTSSTLLGTTYTNCY